MAKYADYVKQPAQGQVEQELQQTQVRPRNIPESVKTRFTGKTDEDIMESYAELQSLTSRKDDEINKLRKSVDQLLELTAAPQQHKEPVTAEPDVQVTVDDVYANPEEAISKVVRKESKETAERLKRLENQLREREVNSRVTDLERKFPDWKNDIQTPEFQQWVSESSYRQRMAAAANQYDFDAANDLLSAWNDKKGTRQQLQQEAVREQQFRDASLESSSPAQVDPVETFSRQDLQERRIRAHQGSSVDERWLKANAPAINAAYRERRITN